VRPPDGAKAAVEARRVEIVPYQPRWAEEFTRLAARLRALAGPAALRIDHIGSTAVPGLGAKDVIDVQVTVAALDRAEALTGPLRAAGFRHGAVVAYDVLRPRPAADPELRKLFMREPEGERRVHVHIRERGRLNQRLALLFRDYLRASAPARAEYEGVKRRAAALFPHDIDAYLDLKDPVVHLLFEAAALWAAAGGWTPPEP
jgi:GrpB-like predicted nucleotidyltransferase (UPF0157 family)